MLDSIFNTWIFSIDTDSIANAHLKCLLGVWVTMLLMIPILLSMYLRIYRVKRVFELYEKYLDKMVVRTNSVFSTFGLSSHSNLLKTSTTDIHAANESAQKNKPKSTALLGLEIYKDS